MLIVQNKLRKPIYYFVIDANTLTFINWAPLSTEHNTIEACQESKIPLEEIFGYQKDRRIVFFYWTKKEPAG